MTLFGVITLFNTSIYFHACNLHILRVYHILDEILKIFMTTIKMAQRHHMRPLVPLIKRGQYISHISWIQAGILM